MSLRIESFTVDARDPMALATWWSEALGWIICFESEDGVEVNLCERLDPDGRHPYPELSFVGDGSHAEGQERIHFCVLNPRPEYAHLGSVAGFTVAAHDAHALRDVWAAATGWDITRDEPDYVVLSPEDGGAPIEIITRPTMPHRPEKDRIHLDVAPGEHDDQAEAVEQLLALGARRADIGQ